MGNTVGRFRNAKKFGLRGVALAIGAALTLGMAVTAPQAAFAAETTAVLDIKKTASAIVIKPGETLTYTIEVSCSTLTALGCEGASFIDPIPAEFEIVSATVANASPNVAQIDGQNVTVIFDEDLGNGTIGLTDNADATITITVKLREDLAHELTDVDIPNTAKVDADNAEEQKSTAVVKPIIEPLLSTKAEKSFNPTAGQAKPGAKTTLTLTGHNKSNGAIDTLTLSDPIDPSAAGNPFDYLEITGISNIIWPEGAATAALEYWDGSAWVAGDIVTKPGAPNAPPGDPKGVRVTFAAANGEKLPQSAVGGLELALEQRPNVLDFDATTVLKNTVESEVSLGKETAKHTAGADYTVVTEPIEVGAKKAFDPTVVLTGHHRWQQCRTHSARNAHDPRTSNRRL